MAGALTIDPMKCFESINALIVGSGGYVLQAAHYPVAKAIYNDSRSAGILIGMGEPFVLVATGTMAHVLHKRGYSLWYPDLVRRVWQDCGGGGLNISASIKAKIQAGVEKARSLVPIPISSYAVSAEASYRRATSATSIAKGVAIVGAATVVAAASAALFMMGMRNVPISGATAGFGVSTRPSLFSSDHNQTL